MKRSRNPFRKKYPYFKYLDFTPTCILEAGVGKFNACRSLRWWEVADCWLFEPLPEYHHRLTEKSKGYPRVRVVPVALWDHEKGVTFYRIGQSSYIEGVTPRVDGTPEERTQEELDQVETTVPSARLSIYDRGDFDLALIDVEAAEWHVLRHMVSRPRLITLEMWRPKVAPNYFHPDYGSIMKWMSDNGYTEVARVKCDSFFKRDA